MADAALVPHIVVCAGNWSACGTATHRHRIQTHRLLSSLRGKLLAVPVLHKLIHHKPAAYSLLASAALQENYA